MFDVLQSNNRLPTHTSNLKLQVSLYQVQRMVARACFALISITYTIVIIHNGCTRNSTMKPTKAIIAV